MGASAATWSQLHHDVSAVLKHGQQISLIDACARIVTRAVVREHVSIIRHVKHLRRDSQAEGQQNTHAQHELGTML